MDFVSTRDGHGAVLGYDLIEIEPYGVSVMDMLAWGLRLQGATVTLGFERLLGGALRGLHISCNGSEEVLGIVAQRGLIQRLADR